MEDHADGHCSARIGRNLPHGESRSAAGPLPLPLPHQSQLTSPKPQPWIPSRSSFVKRLKAPVSTYVRGTPIQISRPCSYSWRGRPGPAARPFRDLLPPLINTLSGTAGPGHPPASEEARSDPAKTPEIFNLFVSLWARAEGGVDRSHHGDAHAVRTSYS